MTNAELLAKIKAEIDKLYSEYKDKFHQSGDQYHLGLIDGLDMAERVLDTLESEKPIHADLEEAADEMAIIAFPEKKSYSTVIDRVVDYNAVDRKNYRDGIIAGAKWQAAHTHLPEDTVLFQNGVEEGKRLMIEDYPKWHKVQRGSCFDKHTNFILSAREGHFYCSSMEVQRDGYILLVDELERLPKEDEK